MSVPVIGPVETADTSFRTIPKFFINLLCNHSDMKTRSRRLNLAVNVGKSFIGNIGIGKHINNSLITILHDFRNDWSWFFRMLKGFVDL